MSAVAEVPIDLYQGEDFACQVVVTDQNGEALNLSAPMQMDVKDKVGQIMFSLNTPTVPVAPGDIPEISYSNDIGLIQLYVQRDVTAALPAGTYNYDLFVTADDNGVYSGDQRVVVLHGQLFVAKRVTEMT
jgi:hypothetical protein